MTIHEILCVVSGYNFSDDTYDDDDDNDDTDDCWNTYCQRCKRTRIGARVSSGPPIGKKLHYDME